MTSADRKYELVLAREEQFARIVATRVVDRPELSVWMILIPLVFLHYMYRHQKFQAAVEIFSEELMFTKKTALEAAFEIKKSGVSKAEALAGCFAAQQHEFSTKADEVRRRQLEEIDLLTDHYTRLFAAEGDSYQSLLMDAYPTRSRYTEFLMQLQQVEKEVNRAAISAFGQAEGFPEIMSRMEAVTEAIRLEETKKIFP
ncbi:MAG: NF038143 family protein [Candidatus Desulforudis sp.]|nr:NF038143 family protein [Desulforudis sp.]